MRPDDETPGAVVPPAPSSLETLDPIDEAVLRAMAPRRVIGAFAFNVVSLFVIVGGATVVSGGGLGFLGKWEFYAGGLVLGTAQSLFQRWLQRRQLQRTSGEALADLRTSWDTFLRPGWALRASAFGVGMAAFFATFAFVLLAIFEPAEVAGGLIEWLRLTALGSAIVVPVMFLLRPFAVWQLRKFDLPALEAPPPSPE